MPKMIQTDSADIRLPFYEVIDLFIHIKIRLGRLCHQSSLKVRMVLIDKPETMMTVNATGEYSAWRLLLLEGVDYHKKRLVMTAKPFPGYIIIIK